MKHGAEKRIFSVEENEASRSLTDCGLEDAKKKAGGDESSEIVGSSGRRYADSPHENMDEHYTVSGP